MSGTLGGRTPVASRAAPTATLRPIVGAVAFVPVCADPGWVSMTSAAGGDIVAALGDTRLSGSLPAGVVRSTGAVYSWETGVGFASAGSLPSGFAPGGNGVFCGEFPAFPTLFVSDGAGTAKTFINDSTINPRFSTGTAMPTPRTDFAGGYSSASDRFVIAGGTLDAGGPTDVVELYDPTGNSWTTGTSMPAAAGACVGQMIGFGGISFYVWTSTGAVYIYDVAGDSWTTGPVAPWSSIGRPCASTMDTFPTSSLVMVGGGTSDEFWWYDTTEALYYAKPDAPTTGLLHAADLGFFYMAITAAGAPAGFACSQTTLATFATP